MKYNNFKKNERSKPRLKLSYRLGYSLVNRKKFKNYERRKWRKFKGFGRFAKPHTKYNPIFHSGVSLKTLYGQRLKSKQAFRASYGKLTEKQLKILIKRSEYGKASSKVNLRGLFERRIDVLVHRLGFAKTIFKARQLVTHKFFKVNGKPVNTPSLILGVGDTICVADRVWDQVYAEFAEQVLIYRKHYAATAESILSLVNATYPNKRQLYKRLHHIKKCSTTRKLKVSKKELHMNSLRYRPLVIPKYMEFDYSTLTAILVSKPNQNEVLYRNKINFKHIREYY